METLSTRETFVSFEVARLLKEKGFDWGCCSYWCVFPNGDIVHTDYGHFANHNGNETDRFISRPTQALAYRWLRETYDIMFTTERKKIVEDEPDPFYDYCCIIKKNGNSYYISSSYLPYTQRYREYEEVIEDALKYCLEILI